MHKRPTIKDVARRAKVSVSTVSLVINNNGYVHEKTREKVLRAVEEVGYYPSRNARGLASRTSGNFGFILQEDHFSQAEPFYTKIFLGAEFEARSHDYYILLTTVSKQCKLKDETPRFLLERNVDGVIIAGKINEKLVDYIDKMGIPVVLVDYDLKGMGVSSVLIDNRGGVRQAILHLVQGGHKSIGFIGGDLEHPSIMERFSSYKETLLENGIAVEERIVSCDEPDTRFENGFNAAKKIFELGSRPTAIFAANDAMAIGCMQYLKQQELSVPNEVALVGFDDIELCTHVEPSLTTVGVPKDEMGKLAVQRLVDVVKSKSRTIVTIRVPVELVIRNSTRLSSSIHESVPSAEAQRVSRQ